MTISWTGGVPLESADLPSPAHGRRWTGPLGQSTYTPSPLSAAKFYRPQDTLSGELGRFGGLSSAEPDNFEQATGIIQKLSQRFGSRDHWPDTDGEACLPERSVLLLSLQVGMVIGGQVAEL